MYCALGSDVSGIDPVDETEVRPALELVLHREIDPRVSVAARMATSASRPAKDLDIRSLRQWTQQLGPRFDGGSAVGCKGDPVAADVLAERVDTARQRFVSLDFQGAEDRLYRFDRDLTCVESVLPQDTLARAFFVRGVLAFTQGDPGAADAAFRDARSMDPELAFDGELAPAARTAFDRAAPGVPDAWIRIVPTPTRVWVDGEAVTYGERGVHVAPGRHLITAELTATTSADVRVDAGGTLLLPGLLGDAVFAQLPQPERRSDVVAVLSSADVKVAWLTDLDTIWQLRDGELTPVYGVELPGKKPKKTKKPKKAG